MSKKAENEKQALAADNSKPGGLDTAGTKGTQSHNNNNEDKPISNPAGTPAGQEAKREDSEA